MKRTCSKLGNIERVVGRGGGKEGGGGVVGRGGRGGVGGEAAKYL